MAGSVLLLSAVFFLNFTSRFMIGPLLPLMKEDMAWSHTQSATIFLAIAVGGLVSLLGSGFFLHRVEYRRAITVSIGAIGLAVIGLGWSSSWLTAAGPAVLIGLGTGIYLTSAMGVMRDLVPPALMGRAMSVYETAPNLGLVLAPLAAEVLLGSMDWRRVLIITGTICLSGSIVWYRFGRGGRFKAHRPDAAMIARTVKRPRIWLLGGLFGLGVTTEVAVYNLLPLFLVTVKDYGLSEANYLLGLSRVPAIGCVLLAGWLSDRFGPRRVMAGMMVTAAAALVCLGLGPAGLTGLCVFIQAAAGAAFFPPALAVMARSGSVEDQALVVSWSSAVSMVIGSGLVPSALGAAADAGYFEWGMAGAGLLIASGITLLPFLKDD